MAKKKSSSSKGVKKTLSKPSAPPKKKPSAGNSGKPSKAKPKTAVKALKKPTAKKSHAKANKPVPKATKPKAKPKAPGLKKAAKPKPGAKAASPKKSVKTIAQAPAKNFMTKPPLAKKAASPTVPKTAHPVQAAEPKPEPKRASPAPVLATAPAEKPVPRQVERKPLKERVVLEFEINSNPNVLYELISSPSGFSEWYCDDVDVRGDHYTFKWGADEEAATMIGRKAPEVIRFRRNDDDDPAAYFEFRIRIDDMTNEVALIVTDHAWPGDVENVRSLWSSQIANLTRVLGA